MTKKHEKEKNEKSKSWKKESRTGAWKNREEMLKRESWKEKIEEEKRFKTQNPSKAGLGKEQDENDSFEIAARRERKEQRRLSFYWTRTYCKTIFQIADKCICLLIACISFPPNKSQTKLLFCLSLLAPKKCHRVCDEVSKCIEYFWTPDHVCVAHWPN